MIFPNGLKALDDVLVNKCVVLEVSLPNCAMCRAVSPALKKIEAEYPHVVFAQINANDFELFCEVRCIQSAPTFLFLSRGVELSRLSGAVSEKVLREEVHYRFHE